MSEIGHVPIEMASVFIRPEFAYSFYMPLDIADKVFTWVHEFTESSVFEALDDMFPFRYHGFHRIKISSDRVRSSFVTVIHIVTSLCTDSLIREDRVSPDEFWVWLQEAKA